jgi:pimeloyl-ACP methyl ester carboxylesterase
VLAGTKGSFVGRRFLKIVGVAVASLLLLAIFGAAGFRLAAWAREKDDRVTLAPAGGRLIPTASGAIFLQDAGPRRGVPVVLFHGTAAWSELWRGTITALTASGYRVIAVDLPPFGFSDRPGTYTREAQAARVNAALMQLGVEPAIIVGHSFGAGAATELAMRYPERARALVLVDAALGLTSPPTATPAWLRPQWVREELVSLTVTNPLMTHTLLQSLLARKDRALPEYVDILQLPMTLPGSTPALADWLLYFTGPDREALSANRAAYSKLTLKTAILWGEQDSVTPLAQAHDLKSLLPNPTFATLPGVGHIPQIEDPDAFNAALLKLLKNM